MKLRDFTARLRDDAHLFSIAYERSRMQNPSLFDEDQDWRIWLQIFALWLNKEHESKT